jgi:pimeloyl-ACP methyl ester carboxylesterase
MRTVVLVHGGWHGPWCWSPVLARLDEAGVPAVAVELGLRNVHDDAAIVTKALDEAGGPVVLAGHSYGGVVITEAGVHRAVKRLVYVCAFAPDEGETPIGLTLDHGEDRGEIGAVLLLHDDGTSTLDPARVGEVLYGDCSPVDVERALGLLRPQVGSTLSAPPDAVAWKTKPVTYVVCGADRGVAPSLQRAMAERIPGVALVEWADSSHSPFFSRPAEVADLLSGLASG